MVREFPVRRGFGASAAGVGAGVQVVGGHAATNILTLLSKVWPKKVEELTARVHNTSTTGGGGQGRRRVRHATRFLEASLRSLDGHDDVYECAGERSQGC
jgi:malate dehydrogenase